MEKKYEMTEDTAKKVYRAAKKVYLYREYNDDYPIGEESITVFASKQRAMAYMKEQFSHDYQVDFERLLQEYEAATPIRGKIEIMGIGITEDDTVRTDYISLGCDPTITYMVEETEIQ